MKSMLKTIFLNMAAIFIVAALFSGLRYSNSLEVLIKAATVLALANAFIKPFLKILFLPINVITFGLFSWLINVVILYVVTLIVPGFSITSFTLELMGTRIVFNQFFATIIIAVALTCALSLVNWLTDK